VYSPVEKKVVLCDHCGGEPTCVSVCPTGALQYLEYKPGEAGERLVAMGEIRNTVKRKEGQR
jgi:ferredoxin